MLTQSELSFEAHFDNVGTGRSSSVRSLEHRMSCSRVRDDYPRVSNLDCHYASRLRVHAQTVPLGTPFT